MNTLYQHLAGESLSDALQRIEAGIKARPADADLRAAFVQFLTLSGNWTRALTQLKSWLALKPQAKPTVTLLEQSIEGELQRARVFAGQARPSMPEAQWPWLTLLADALMESGERAQALRLAALEQALLQCKEQKLKVLALVGVAGSTDFGSIDPLPELAAIAEREQIHFHVDAAWGGPTLFSPRYQGLLDGIAQADTVTLDGHKQLLVPLGTGMLLCRQPDLMMTVKREAPYAIRASSFDQGRFTLEGTRPANALYLDAAFQLLGQQGYAQLIDANYDRARRMAELIDAHPAFELMSAPVMNLLSYRCIPPHLQGKALDEAANEQINAFNVALQKAQRAEGHSFVSRTQRAVSRYGAQPLTLLRAVLLNPLIEERHIRGLLDDQLRLGSLIASQLFDQTQQQGPVA